MNIVLTDWRGIFTAEHPTLVKIPYAPNTYYRNLAEIALSVAPHASWKQLASLSLGTHTPYTATLLEHPTQARNILVASGDARTLLHHSSLTSNNRQKLLSDFLYSESNGYLCIGIATKHMHAPTLNTNDIHEMNFLGTALASFDNVPESSHVVRRLRNKNIQVKIVSSMPLRLSQAIVRSVGLIATEDSSITGSIIACMSDNELREFLPHVNIFAELEFADEERIARLLEESGHRIHRNEFYQT